MPDEKKIALVEAMLEIDVELARAMATNDRDVTSAARIRMRASGIDKPFVGGRSSWAWRLRALIRTSPGRW